ncbi:MAG: hypothetical protein KAH54_09170 [Candidatus Sabulitectum sp.]|nr:hypothetical protein [Candidatus Sabulitectum sp.]
MSLFLVILLTGLLPDFNTVLPVQFHAPEGWHLDCTSLDSAGRIIAGCSRWNPELLEHEVLLFMVWESVDTVMIDDQRITRLTSICPDSRGGYFVTFPSEFRSDEVFAARLNADGSLDWLADQFGDTEEGLDGLIAFAETPYGGYVLGGNPYNSDGNKSFYIAVIGEDGVLFWEAEGELYAEVNAVAAYPQGLILAGEKTGSELTQAFAWCYSYTGDLLWEHGYDLGGFSEFDCVASLTDGYVFGGTHWPMETPQCGLLIRTDLLGNEMWRKLIPPEEGYQQVYILSVLGRNNGSIVAAGFSVRDNAPRNTSDAMAILLSSDGIVSDYAFSGKPEQNHEEINRIFQDQDNALRFYGCCYGDDYDGVYYFAFPPVYLDE